MIPQDTVNKILDAAQITDVVSDFVTLKRRGANYVACCPFHNEKTPSFYVSPSKGIYKCFGCGKSGTAVGFIMEHEGLSYVEALKYLARKYGIEVIDKEETAEDIARRQRSESLLLVSEFAHKFFVGSLDTEEGRTIGLAYFRSRGLEEETIRKYGLGWAPKDRKALLSEALAKGYKEEYLVDTGLCIKYDDGHLADRFFDRVIFPIHSVSGRVIAFGGRTLRSDKTVAKYVNSPETEIYDKSRSLYGIWFAKGDMSRLDKCYLVEGYLDVLSMHQLGIKNVVASSGTSLTIPQIRLIKKFTENVTIMYDGDSAGIKAALRGIGLVLQEGLNVKVVLLPDGDDPDSFSRKHSLEEVQDFIAANEQDFIAFKTELLLGEAGGDPLKKANLINDIADTIALIPDAVKRSVYAQASADRFDIDSTILFNRIRNTRESLRQTLPSETGASGRPSGSTTGASSVISSGSSSVISSERSESRNLTSTEISPLQPSAFGRNDNEVGGPSSVISSGPSSVISSERSESRNPFYEYPTLAASEQELLSFIYRYGRRLLEFESDSPFYCPDDPITVADFIRDCLEADDFAFMNTSYRKLYDSYFGLYDSAEQPSQKAIVMTMLNGPDRQAANLVADLIQEKHLLTVKRFQSAMMSEASMLVTFVPKAIQVYQLARVNLEISLLGRRLKSSQGLSDDEALSVLAKIQDYTNLRKKLEEMLGRVN